MRKNHSNPLKDPKTHHPIENLDLPFSQYISQCKSLIESTRVDLDQHPEKTILANCPFEFQPSHGDGKTGMLLVHGLLDSPFIMRDIGLRLQEKGFLARGLLLPGHGTTPGDLLSVNYQQWIQAVRYGIASLKKEVEHIYIVGFSTGATLGLYHALHQAPISGLISLAPAIKIRSKFDFSTNWHTIISWFWERAKWLRVAPEDDYAKYQSIPFNAAYQVYKLTQLIKKLSKTHSLNCPLFFVLSLADSTVSSRASIEYFHDHANPKNQMLLYAREKNHENDLNTIVRSSIYPEMHIQDFSHVSLPLSPNNEHYGKHGDSIHASRIDVKEGAFTYGAFNKLENQIFDLLYASKLIQMKRKRLSYNPDFDFLMEKMFEFINIR